MSSRWLRLRMAMYQSGDWRHPHTGLIPGMGTVGIFNTVLDIDTLMNTQHLEKAPSSTLLVQSFQESID